VAAPDREAVEITLYEVLLFAHLTFVAIWVGGDAMLQVVYLRARRESAERTLNFLADVEWIGTRVLTPAALLVVGFGRERPSSGRRPAGCRSSARIAAPRIRRSRAGSPGALGLEDRAGPADRSDLRHGRQTGPLNPENGSRHGARLPIDD